MTLIKTYDRAQLFSTKDFMDQRRGQGCLSRFAVPSFPSLTNTNKMSPTHLSPLRQPPEMQGDSPIRRFRRWVTTPSAELTGEKPDELDRRDPNPFDVSFDRKCVMERIRRRRRASRKGSCERNAKSTTQPAKKPFLTQLRDYVATIGQKYGAPDDSSGEDDDERSSTSCSPVETPAAVDVTPRQTKIGRSIRTTGVDALQRHLDEMVPVRDKELSERAERYIAIARAIRDGEAREVEAGLVGSGPPAQSTERGDDL